MSLRNGRTRLSASEIIKIRPKRLEKRKFFPHISPKLLRELCAEKDPKDFLLSNELIQFAESNRHKLQASPYHFPTKDAVDTDTNGSTVTATITVPNEQTSTKSSEKVNISRSKKLKPGDSASFLFQSSSTPKKQKLPKKSKPDDTDDGTPLDGLRMNHIGNHHRSLTPNYSQDMNHSRHQSKNDLQVLTCDVRAANIIDHNSNNLQNSPPVGISIGIHVNIIVVAVITSDDLFTVFDCSEGMWRKREFGNAGGYRQLYWFTPRRFGHHEQMLYILMAKDDGIRICSIPGGDRSNVSTNHVIKFRVCNLTLVNGSEICACHDDHHAVQYAWHGGQTLEKVLTFPTTTEKLLSLLPLSGHPQGLVGCTYAEVYIWSTNTGQLLKKVDVGFTLYTDLLTCAFFRGTVIVHRVTRQRVSTAECCELIAISPKSAKAWVVERHKYDQSYIDGELLRVNMYDARTNTFGRIHDAETVRKLFADIRLRDLDNSVLKLAGSCAEIKYKKKRSHRSP